MHILEAKDIKASGKAGGGGILSNFEGQTADPMVEVSVSILSKLSGKRARPEEANGLQEWTAEPHLQLDAVF